MSRSQQLLLMRRGGGVTYAEKVIGILSTNAVALWPFTETSGTVTDNAEGTAARDGTYTGVTLNNTTFLDGSPAPLLDGVNDFVNVYGTGGATATALTPKEFTIGAWIKVPAGVWTDGLTRRLFYLEVDANNFLQIVRSTTSGRLELNYKAGGVQKNVVVSSLSYTGWFFVAMVVSLVGDYMQAYIGTNGAVTQTGSDQTGLGTFAGAFNSDRFTVGTLRATSPIQCWSGNVSHLFINNAPLSLANIQAIGTV